MDLTDDNLREVAKGLTAKEWRILERHFYGKRTDESWTLLRWIRADLKRKARARKARLATTCN